MTAKRKTPRKRGSPTKYREAFPAIAEELYRNGGTNAEAGKKFKVRPETITDWINRHPEFAQAVQRGRDHFDTTEVEVALCKRAIGYQHAETKLHVIDGKIIPTELTKHYPPDTTAAIFWLKNRHPERWREHQQIDLGASDELVAALADPLAVIRKALETIDD